MNDPKKIRDTYVGASKGWWIIDPITKVYIEGNSYKTLRGKFIEHRKSNNLDQNIDQEIHNQICSHEDPSFCQEWPTSGAYAPQAQIEVTITEMVSNFTQSMKTWIGSGMPITTEDKFKNRLNTCRNCEYWDEKAYLGKGKCKKCGCSGLKLHLDTSKCPINKW